MSTSRCNRTGGMWESTGLWGWGVEAMNLFEDTHGKIFVDFRLFL